MDVLYITGRGGSLNKGLAAYLASSVKGFEGVAVDTQFLKKRPLEQVEFIRQKMVKDPARLVIANSYGAYLVLHALAQIEDLTPENVLLLSPLLGVGRGQGGFYMNIPPLLSRLEEAFATGALTRPKSIKFLVGELDQQINSEQVGFLDQYFGLGSVHVFPEEGHMLSPQSIQKALTAIEKIA